MNSSDYALADKYKNMCGLNNINLSSFIGSVTINSDLYISSPSVFQNIIINSNLTILNNSVLNNTIINNNVYVSGISTIQNNLSCYSDLSISNNMYINSKLNIINNAIFNNLTLASSLNVSNNSILSNGIIVNNISPITNNLIINSNTINIGNSNSIVNIIGTSTYIATTNIELKNKIITLNSQPLDIGNLAGIQIYGTNNNIGYIRTNTTASRFEIKSPIDITSNYIALIDTNYNLNISGSSILQNNVSIMSDLYISSTAIFNNLSINSNLNISGSSILRNVYANNINISNNSILQNVYAINLNVSGYTNINNNCNINSSINLNNSILNNVTLLSNLNNNLNSNIILNNNVSVNSNLYLNNCIINGYTTIGSQLNILNNTVVNSKATILSNINVSGTSIINNNSTILSSLNVFGSTRINGNITFNSNLNTNLNIIMPLIEYADNNSAALAGVPLWGFYRTGDIVKIRVDNTPPIITLLGVSTVSLSVGIPYVEPGLIITDNLGENIQGYIISITVANNTSLTNILVTGTSTIIPISLLNTNSSNIYTITYSAIDSYNNVSTATRQIIILSLASYNTTNGNLQISNGLNFNSLSGVDWTCEIWMNMTATNGSNAIIDFRQPNNGAYSPPNHFWCEIDGSKPYIQAMTNRSYIGSSINKTIPLNKWTHVVWMRKNNKLYTFINGYPSPGEPIPSYLNSLSELNYMVHGVYSDWVASNSTSGHFMGELCQPLITLGAKYSTSGFTPVWLLSSNLVNALYFAAGNSDLISGLSLVLNRTVINTTILSSPLIPIITLTGGCNITVNLNDSYNELGFSAIDYFGNLITITPSVFTISGTVNTSILGTYQLTYLVNSNNNTQNIIRYVYVLASAYNIFSNLIFWIDPSTITNSSNYVSIQDYSPNSIIMNNSNTNLTKINKNGINNRSVLDFTNGSGLKSNFTFMNSYNVTLAIIVTFFTTNNGCIWGHFNNYNNDINLINTGNYINWHTYNDYSNANITYLPNIPVLFIGTLTNGTSRFFQMINLNTGSIVSISKTNLLSMNLANAYIYLGSNNNNNPANCYVGECMYWTRVLTSTELSTVTNYLYNKWQINNNNININIFFPSIKLIGSNNIYIYINSTYTELGAIATNYSGNTLSYTISNSVDNTIASTYVLTYIVTDNYGTSSISRTVNIISLSIPMGIDVFTNNCNVNLSMPLIDPSSVYTIQFWFYFKSPSTPNITGIADWRYYQSVLLNFTDSLTSPTRSKSFAIYNYSNGNPVNVFYIALILSDTLYDRGGMGSPPPLGNNQWNHIAITFQQSQNWILFWINGKAWFNTNPFGVGDWQSSWSGIKYITIGYDTYTDNANLSRRSNYLISQLVIQKGSPYGIRPYPSFVTQFIPPYNLNTQTNMVFFLDGNPLVERINNTLINNISNIIYSAKNPKILKGYDFSNGSLSISYPEPWKGYGYFWGQYMNMFTIEFWIYLNPNPGGDSIASGNMNILGCDRWAPDGTPGPFTGNGTYSSPKPFWVMANNLQDDGISAGPNWRLIIGTTTGWVGSYVSNQLITQQWTHCAITSLNDIITFYYNGIPSLNRDNIGILKNSFGYLTYLYIAPQYLAPNWWSKNNFMLSQLAIYSGLKYASNFSNRLLYCHDIVNMIPDTENAGCGFFLNDDFTELILNTPMIQYPLNSVTTITRN